MEYLQVISQRQDLIRSFILDFDDENRGRADKKIMFITLIVGLSIPFIQFYTHFANEKALKGAIEQPKKPVLKLDHIISCKFQEEFEKYYNEQFGFRPSFIRLNNQIKYWAFNKVQANGVVIGKKHIPGGDPPSNHELGTAVDIATADL